MSEETKQASEPTIEHMEYSKERGLEIKARHPEMSLFTNMLLNYFKAEGGVDYLEVGVFRGDTGPVLLTIQRQEGKTPGAKADEWKQKYESLLSEQAEQEPDLQALWELAFAEFQEAVVVTHGSLREFGQIDNMYRGFESIIERLRAEKEGVR